MDLLPQKWELAVEVLHTNARCQLVVVSSPELHTNARSRAQPSSIKPPGPLMQYKSLVEQGKLQHDPKQETVAFQLEELLGRLEQYEREMARATPQSILDWARDQLGLGASQLGRVEGFHRVLGSFSAGCWAKCPPLELL